MIRVLKMFVFDTNPIYLSFKKHEFLDFDRGFHLHRETHHVNKWS